MSSSISNYLYLALWWSLWCGLHSLMAFVPLRNRLQGFLGLSIAAYRVVYSIIALATFIPLMWYSLAMGAIRPFFCPLPWLWLQLGLWLVSAWALYWASRSFNRGGFDLTGFSDFRQGNTPQAVLVTSGAYAYCRNPMDAPAFLAIWCRTLGPGDVIINLIVMAYFILGDLHEEKRLTALFGQQYLDYKAQVPRYLWRIRPYTNP